MDNLNEMGLVKLSKSDKQNIAGGLGLLGAAASLAIGMVGSAIYDCIANHEAFGEGFKEGYADTAT